MYSLNNRETFTKEEPYEYYKITRKYDGFTTYCATLNFIENYIKMLFGTPDIWIESEEKAVMKIRYKELLFPLGIEAETEQDQFEIIFVCLGD